MTKSTRINFGKTVVDNLYRQAGGSCSFPRCKNPTMGPYYSKGGAVNMGFASHIYSAAENGPRGRGGMDNEFIKSEKNGIWLCAYHAFLIDKAKGNDYSAEDLFRWKNIAEARALKKMNDMPSPLGWVESIELTTFPTTLNILPKVTLSHRTILYGRNCSGKSTLALVAACISNSVYAERFKSQKVDAKVIYTTVDSLNKEITLKFKDVLTRFEGSTQFLLPPGDLEVIYYDDSLIQQSHEDDIDFMMRLLNIDKSALFSLTKIGINSILAGVMCQHFSGHTVRQLCAAIHN